MKEIVKDIVFAVLGAVTLVTGLLTKAGWEVNVLGGLILAAAVGCGIYELVKKNKKQ